MTPPMKGRKNTSSKYFQQRHWVTSWPHMKGCVTKALHQRRWGLRVLKSFFWLHDRKLQLYGWGTAQNTADTEGGWCTAV
jgi:hypothetical protein